MTRFDYEPSMEFGDYPSRKDGLWTPPIADLIDYYNDSRHSNYRVFYRYIVLSTYR